MAIITLTSDLGIRDPYVAILKAGILRAIPDAVIADISHEIAPYNISQGAYILKSAYAYFPENTIHIAAVDAGNALADCIALRCNGHFFIGPDNGILSLVTDNKADEIAQLPKPETQSSFAARDVLVGASVQLLQGKSLKDIGLPVQHMLAKVALSPPVNNAGIIAGVLHIDRFGNIILNVTRSRFDEVVQGREVRVSYSRKDVFEKISNNYSDVRAGERLIFFNSAGYLEIAVNKGNAHLLLGIQMDARIQIEIV